MTIITALGTLSQSYFKSKVILLKVFWHLIVLAPGQRLVAPAAGPAGVRLAGL